MTPKKREREIRYRMSKYASYVKEIKDFEDDILFKGKQFDITGVRGSGISDPSARAGIALVDKPSDLVVKEKWVEAINEGMKELIQMDDGDKKGYAYIAAGTYGIPSKKFQIGTIKIASECHLSRTGVYYKLATITYVMMYHATIRGLI